MVVGGSVNKISKAETAELIRKGASQIFSETDDTAIVSDAILDELMDRERIIAERKAHNEAQQGADQQRSAVASFLDSFTVQARRDVAEMTLPKASAFPF